MSNSTRSTTKSTTPRKRRSGRSKSKTELPPKPYKDFPLTPHASGAWQKKIRGQTRYFGKWGRRVNGKMERLPGDGWKEALDQYDREKDDWFAGRTPGARSAEPDKLTVNMLRERFLTAKSRALDSKEITQRTYSEYRATTDRLITAFGKHRLIDNLTTGDFEHLRAEVAKVWGPVRLANEIQRVRTVFKYGYEAGLIDKPVRFGPQFKKPSKSVMRKHRAEKGTKLFTAGVIHKLAGKASSQLKAMIYLGVNCGFGNADCGSLPLSAVDLKGGWITFPRPKTGIARRCPLWPETVEALKAAIEDRPNAKRETDGNLVFITKYGEPWTKADVADSPVTKETRKLLDELKIHREGLGFYALRHTFRTVADATRDIPAVRLIMGHADGSIDDVYREHIEDSRLKAVTDHVHSWLWPVEKKPTKTTAKGKAESAKPKTKKAARSQNTGETAEVRLRIVG